MYRVKRWNHHCDEMTEEFVNVLEGIAVDGYGSVTWVPSVPCVNRDEVIPVLQAGPGGVRRFAP
jgi:hypothetical protein